MTGCYDPRHVVRALEDERPRSSPGRRCPILPLLQGAASLGVLRRNACDIAPERLFFDSFARLTSLLPPKVLIDLVDFWVAINQFPLRCFVPYLQHVNSTQEQT